MSGSFAVSGLISGLDTDAIIQSLVDVRTAQQILPLQDQILELSSKQSALESVEETLDSLRSESLGLRSLANFEGRIANSSDTVSAEISSVSSSAIKGTYTVNITQLAQADRNYFAGVGDEDLTQFGTGTISIESSGSIITIEIDSDNNTLKGIRDAINASEASVTASIVNDGDPANPYRLVLTSDETGSDADIIQDISAVLTLADDAVLNADATNQAQDTDFTVNGLAITVDSNTVSDAIPGVTFNLLAAEGTDFTVTVNEDHTNSLQKIADFLNAYNGVMAEFQNQFSVDDLTGASVGVLSSDFTMQNIQARINDLVLRPQNQLAGNEFKALAEIGITLNEDGFLVLDQGVLTDALNEDSDSVRRLFQGMSSDVDGIADNVYLYLNDITNPADGLLAKKDQIWQSNIDDLIDLIEEREDRIADYEQGLKDKFLYMEQTLLALENQSAQLDSAQTQLENLAKAKN